MPVLYPFVFQASYWEFLLGWGHWLLGDTGKGLIEGQLFGQWCHAVLGFGGTGLAVQGLAHKILPKARYSWIAAIFGVTFFSTVDLVWAGSVAKNDLGALFWFFTGICLVLDQGKSRFIGYFLLGLSLGTKPSLLLCLAPLATALVAFGRIPIKDLVIGSTIALVGIAPILAHFYAHTGNPFFPYLNGIFLSHWVSLPVQYLINSERLSQLTPLIDSLMRAGSCLVKLSWQNPIFIGLAFMPVASFFLKGERFDFRTYYALVCGSLMSFFLLGLTAGPEATMRVNGAGIVCLTLTATIALQTTLTLCLKPWDPYGKSTSVALGVLLLFFSGVPWISTWKGYLHWIPPHLLNRETHIGGDSKTWLRFNAGTEDLILTTGDDQLYYLSGLKVASTAHHPVVFRHLNAAFASGKTISALRDFGAKYLLDTSHWKSPYWSYVAQVLTQTLVYHPEGIAYDGRESRVIDLVRLEESILQATPYRKEFLLLTEPKYLRPDPPQRFDFKDKVCKL